MLSAMVNTPKKVSKYKEKCTTKMAKICLKLGWNYFPIWYNFSRQIRKILRL